jgi:hypothetical protein
MDVAVASTPPHAFKLLRDLLNVGGGQIPRAQQGGLLIGPSVKIGFVERQGFLLILCPRKCRGERIGNSITRNRIDL